MRASPFLILLAVGCDPAGSGTVPLTGTTSTPTETVADGVTVRNGPVVQPHKIVEIELPVAAGVELSCTMVGDAEEVLVWEDADVTDAHTLDLLGLAAGESYTCEVVAEGSEVATFVLDVELTPAPAFTVEHNGQMSGVYTFTNNADGGFREDYAHILIVDPEGRVRWFTDLGPDLVMDIDFSLAPDGRVHAGGGWGLLDQGQRTRGVFRTMELDGTIVHDREDPDFGLGFNHHSEPMEDGTFVSLTTTWHQPGTRGWYGVAVERWDPAIGAPSWTWDTTRMLEAGQIAFAGEENPYHANSVSFVEDADGPAMMLSLYAAQEIWRIDLDTGLRSWKLGPGGHFTLVDRNGQPLPDEKWFYVQHDPDWTNDGRVLLYDNGYERPGPKHSRAAEYQLDTTAMTATLVWEWTEPGWYNPIVGDADWLPNGNVLVARGFVRGWSPNSQDRTQIVEVDPRTDEVIWRMRWPSGSQSLFRAERYEGCDLFANNRKYCPSGG